MTSRAGRDRSAREADRSDRALGVRAPGTLRGAILTTYLARFATLIAFVALLPPVMATFGSEAYGLYALTASVAAIFQQDLGIGDATTRFIAVAFPARDAVRMRRIAAAGGAFYLVTATVMAAATAVGLGVVLPRTTAPAELHDAAWAMAAFGVANVFVILAFSTHRQILVGVGRLHDVNVLLIGQAVLRIGLTLAVCAMDLGIAAVALADLVSSAVFALALVLMRRRRAPQVGVRLREFRWTVFRELFAVSAQLMVLGIASVVIMQIGGVLTALLLPIAFTALYAAAQRIYMIVKEVTGSLAVAVLPTASMRHGEGDGGAIGRLYLRGTGYANMLMTLVLVPALVFMPQVMNAWLGAQGAPAVIVAQLLLLSLFANNNHLLAVPVLTAQGSVRGFALLHAVWAVSGIVGALLLGSELGLAGIALGLTIPVVLLEPVYVAIALRRLGLRAREFLWRCLVLPFGTVAPLAALLFVVERWLRPGLGTAVMLSIGWGIAAVVVYGTIAVDRRTRARVLSFLRPADPATAGPAADGGSARAMPASALPKELT